MKQFDLDKIPTRDPNAALLFCQALAKVIAQPESGTAVDSPDLQARKPKLSFVIPVYNEQDNLPILFARLSSVMEEIEPDFEIIFVDDGSRDGSLVLLQDLARKDSRVCVVELARNFGHQIAISAGLDYASGDGVVIMDADLQDPPEVLPEFIAKWREGYDVVYAVRRHRKENWFKRYAYKFFYRLLKRIANIDIPLDAGDFCIMDRRVVQILVNMPERNRFIRGIRSWIGLEQTGLDYERHARYAGDSKFTFVRLLYLALDGLVSFSFIPLRAIAIVGFVVSAISILSAFVYLILRLTVGVSPLGFTTIIVAIFFLAGIQLVTIGVIGEYVGRVFEEVKRRPLYVVRKTHGYFRR
jgi:dolichol-phosphate mannosyltransferase